MLIKEIQLQTNHLSAIHHFYKDVLELNTVYRDKNGIVISAGKSELIFEELMLVQTHFIILLSIFHPTSLKKHLNG